MDPHLLIAARDQPQAGGICAPAVPVRHREHEYDSQTFETLATMQRRHFWYRGRHRFLLAAVRRSLARVRPATGRPLAAVDLGGGCGGWIDYLSRAAPRLFGELALADSSLEALVRAAEVVGRDVSRFQIDLLRLEWTNRWDAAFLLDVLEHIPEDVQVLQHVRKSLRPGGLLFVTTPALARFWTYNDDLVQHVRRYSRADFAELARRSGLELLDARYFMFLLSPLLYLARRRPPDVAAMTPDAIREHLRRTHRVPPAPVNELLGLIFALETPAGLVLRFPWGTSILGVFRKTEA
ncbi:MAG TPA: class I SAM-dependent methyltransferase [Planctomycetaceae bacterium]|nr:class I SAM-dependent methyltransferase [Planctomycetaceae bacterium]